MIQEEMFSSLMTVFLTAPAVRKQNWVQRFLTIRICISKKRGSDAHLKLGDGNTLILVNRRLLTSAKDTNIIGPVKTFDNRTLAGKKT